MAQIITDDQHYKNIANAIRQKNQLTTLYTPSEMANAIKNLSGSGSQCNLTKLEAAYNGTYLPSAYGVDGFNEVKVNVIDTSTQISARTFTQNGTYYAANDGVDGYNPVTIQVAGGKPEQVKTVNIQTNGSHSVEPDVGKTLSRVQVNVQVPTGGGGETCSQITASIPENSVVNTGFQPNGGKVEVWGWGASGTEWDATNCIFLGNAYSQYIGGETTPLTALIEGNGNLNLSSSPDGQSPTLLIGSNGILKMGTIKIIQR